MTDRKLYACAISSDSQTRGQARAQQKTSKLGALESDTGVVESIATEPGEQRLVLEYRGKYAEKMASELDELANASAIESVPYHATSESTPMDGYYTVSTSTSGRTDPRASELAQFDGKLARKGTRSSHRRGVETAISQADHPFGNDTTAHIGVPATANKVRWHNPETGETAIPSLVATRNAELGDVEIYDAQAAPYSNPTAIYDIAYTDETATDVRVWDERGLGGKTDANGHLQWAKCFVASHDFSGEAIADNGLLRLRFDEATPALSVERWDNTNGVWSSQALGTSDWEFYDLNVSHVGMGRVGALVEFRNPVASPTDYYTLRCVLPRGYNDPVWAELKGTNGTPTGLVDLLTPVASTQAYTAGAEKGLVDRGEL